MNLSTISNFFARPKKSRRQYQYLLNDNRKACCERVPSAFRILLFGERRAADDETEDTLRGPLRGHSGEPRRCVRALPQTKRSAAVALGVSSRSLHDRRVHRPLVQIETHARYFRSSKYRSKRC